MLVVLTFLMGVANFALHRAVLSSRNPLLEGLAGGLLRGAGRLTLLFEFLVLVVALAFAFQAAGWAALAYAIYTAANAFAAWLILSGKF